MRFPYPGEIFEDFRTLFMVYRGGEVPWRYDGKSRDARVAVILGAQVLAGGRASKTLEARVRHAARLYAAGGLDLLIPTGGLGEHPPREAEIMAEIMRSEGVPDEAMLLEDQALNTWDSAVRLAYIAREKEIEEVRAVTDPLHCVRTVRAFREAGLKAWAEPVYSSPMWRVPWMRRGQLAREMGASVWYRAKHGIGSRSPL
jgi:uncharacterized SAM-binding protein YcdF (DUF218 family)